MNILTKVAILALLDNASAKKKCPFGYGASSKEETDEVEVPEEVKGAHPRVQAGETYLSELYTCGTTAPTVTPTNNKTNAQYEAIVSTIIAKWNSISSTVTDNSNPRGSYAGCLVRLAGHDFMDFRFGTSNTGGSDGCLNFNDADNGGLATCLGENTTIADYQTHCADVSLADYVVI